MGDCDKRLFHGLSAWFSSSVRNKRRQLWENGGGELTPFDKAQFLFSESAESDDTKSIFRSEAYLQEHLAVFHSMYIDKCRELGDRAEVKLGDYFLPPTEIQTMARKQMHYKWELDYPDNDHGDSEHGNRKCPTFRPQQQQQQHQQREEDVEPMNIQEQDLAPEELPSTSTDDGYIDVKNLPKFTGPLTEFKPGMEGFEVLCVR